MHEPEPMTWSTADAWDLAGPYPDLSHSGFHARLREAIALARREKERADAIGVTVKVQGPDALGKFVASCDEVPGALGYGDTPHEAEISSRRAIVPVLMTMLEQQKERAETAEEMLADLPNWEINYATLKDLADKLAEAVEDEMATEGYLRPPLEDALRAYRGVSRPTSQFED